MISLARRAILVVAVVAPLFACKLGSGGGGLSYEVEGKQQQLETKSGYYYASTMTYSYMNAEPKIGMSTDVALANFDVDPSSGPRTMFAPLSSDGQVQLRLDLIGAEGTRGQLSTEPPAAGKYTAEAKEFMKVGSAEIVIREGGKEKSHTIKDEAKGFVEVTKSSGDTF